MDGAGVSSTSSTTSRSPSPSSTTSPSARKRSATRVVASAVMENSWGLADNMVAPIAVAVPSAATRSSRQPGSMARR
jgi:hypothetical protein